MDFFKDLPESAYSLCYDYTFFCAIPPTMRAAWAEAYAGGIRSGGVLITMMWPIGAPFLASICMFNPFSHLLCSWGARRWPALLSQSRGIRGGPQPIFHVSSNLKVLQMCSNLTVYTFTAESTSRTPSKLPRGMLGWTRWGCGSESRFELLRTDH